MLSTRSLYSGGTFYFSERKQDNFYLVKIFIYLLHSISYSCKYIHICLYKYI